MKKETKTALPAKPSAKPAKPQSSKKKPHAQPRWLSVFAQLLILVYPLALLGAGVALFCVFGATGWLWLVVLLVIVLAVVRPSLPPPPQPPSENK